MKRTIGVVALVAYVGTIFLANWLIVHVGIVNVGFGLQAPAAVFAAGAAFTFRDVVQRELGRLVVVAAIVVGALLSLLVAPAFALASGAAFLVSELADFGVYTPLAEKSWLGAVALSNTAGAVIDSLIFLLLAFGSLQFFWGQVVGKTWVTLVSVAVLAAVRATWRLRTA